MKFSRDGERAAQLAEKIYRTASNGCKGDGHVAMQALLIATGTFLAGAPQNIRENFPPQLMAIEALMKEFMGALEREQILMDIEKDPGL